MLFGSLRVLLLALASLAASTACGSGGDDGPSAGASSPEVAAASSSSAAPGSPEQDLPRPGTARAWLEGDRLVSALANQAPRGAIVAALAEAAGFDLVLGTQADLAQPLTLSVQSEPLELVLVRILAGVSHAVTYEKDPASGAQRLVRLTLGLEPQVASTRDRAGRGRERSRPELAPEQREARAERGRRLREESLAKLVSRDEVERADGVKWLDVSSTEGFEAAKERLEGDESPAVRAAAAEVLLESDVGAVQPLLQALDDPDPRVVLAALEALEFVGDASTVPRIAPLLKHKDVEVRERTVEAIEFLQ